METIIKCQKIYKWLPIGKSKIYEIYTYCYKVGSSGRLCDEV